MLCLLLEEEIWLLNYILKNTSFERTTTSLSLNPCYLTLQKRLRLLKLAKSLKQNRGFILNTHHHYDHTDANAEIKKRYDAKVVGAEYDKHRIPEFEIGVKDGDVFELGEIQSQDYFSQRTYNRTYFVVF